MKLPRISKIFLRYLLGPLLLIVLLWAIGEELLSQQRLPLLIENLRSAIVGTASTQGILLMTLLFILMLVNWSLEALKWRTAISTLQPVSFFTAFKATLSGVSFSVSLPNRVGEYLGRMLYLKEDLRLKAIPVTVIASLSQLLITILVGLCSYLYLIPDLGHHQVISNTTLVFFAMGVLFLLVVLSFFYFSVGGLPAFLAVKIPVKWLTQWTEGLTFFTRAQLMRLLSLSAFRYVIFLLQYACAFALFHVSLPPIEMVASVGFCFLLLSIVPNFAIAELGIRGLIGVWVVGLFSANKTGILLATLTIWLVNLILPAVVGALLLLGIRKLYVRRDEKN